MEWHPRAPVLLAGTADGNTWMWKVPNGDCKTFQGPNCPATCGRVLPDGKSNRVFLGVRDASSDLEVLQSSQSPALYLVLPVTPGGIWEPPALSFLFLLSLVCLSALCPLVVCALVLREESCRRV